MVHSRGYNQMTNTHVFLTACAPAQTILDDRRSSLPEVEASPPAGKRAVIKSADMKDDMQKEAIEIAISVSLSYSLFVVYPILFTHLVISGVRFQLSVVLSKSQFVDLKAFEKYSVEKDIAENIKKEFDKKHGATWHCIVGRNFGSYVTHETNHFVYFYLDQKAVLLFKSG
ncbi:unnamed protein product [Arabidopsis thaliana]|uniref:Dynein light chain n=1 Tax=Arabidopsis thaliana TaxID=3702 RepID=A0A7G2EYE7_ARATH|nr:unnamed protein product [Arabidopsis thaliana]